MEAHAHFHWLRGHVPHLHLVHRETTTTTQLLPAGLASGLTGGLALAAPLVIYDWARASHSALELPMAVNSWLFGLDHFAVNGYRWWPIVIGAAFLLLYCGVQGLAFAEFADLMRPLAGGLTLGAVWSFVSFMFFWYMLLPIARDGAPFRATAAGVSVAPNWVWILGFALAGPSTAVAYRALMRRTATRPATTSQGTSEQVA